MSTTTKPNSIGARRHRGVARNAIAALCLLLSPMLAFCQAWLPQAYHLVEDATGKPLLTLPNGEPEAFIAAGGDLLFLGFFTRKEIRQEARVPAGKLDGLGVGARFQLRDEQTRVRVERWCCDQYSLKEVQHLREWKEYSRRLTDQVEEFGSDELTKRLDYCDPFSNTPAFLFDRVSHAVRWTKFFAIARSGYDNGFKACDRQDWHVFSYADIGSSLDAQSVLVRVSDARSVQQFLRVSAADGQIVGPNPAGVVAVDANEILAFKKEFLAQNPCPQFTTGELAQEDRYQATSTGRCYVGRKQRYADALLKHFLGTPKPPPELK